MGVSLCEFESHRPHRKTAFRCCLFCFSTAFVISANQKWQLYHYTPLTPAVRAILTQCRRAELSGQRPRRPRDVRPRMPAEGQEPRSEHDWHDGLPEGRRRMRRTASATAAATRASTRISALLIISHHQLRHPLQTGCRPYGSPGSHAASSPAAR